MDLVLFGTTHRNCGLARLHAGARCYDELLIRLLEARQAGSLAGAIVLRTCNRLEVLIEPTAGVPPDLERLGNGIFDELEPHQILGDAALAYMLRVATGLESLVLGEDQILGQLRSAFQVAADRGLLSRGLRRLQSRLVAAARNIRRQAGLAGSKTSVAAIGARELCASIAEDAPIAVLGAGETARLAIATLLRSGRRNIVIVNRSLHRAEELASEHGLLALGLDAFLTDAAVRAPIRGLFVAVHSDRPFLGQTEIGNMDVIVDVSMPGTIMPGTIMPGTIMPGTIDRRRMQIDADLGSGSLGPKILDMDGIGAIIAAQQARTSTAVEHASRLVDERVDLLRRQLRRTPAPDFDQIVAQHLDRALEELDAALRGRLSHLPLPDRSAIRSVVVRAARRNAHFHVKDIRQQSMQ